MSPTRTAGHPSQWPPHIRERYGVTDRPRWAPAVLIGLGLAFLAFVAFLGLRLSNPAGGPVWKVDLWTARAEEFARGNPNRARWAALLTEESRVHILAIKEAVCGQPEYRRELLSIHIYEAVLDRGVRGIEQFWDWWRARSRVPEANTAV